jgi:hypothetical protein
MACDAHDLNQVMQQYLGGSDQRYRHQFNPRFIYTEGVRDMAQTAGAYWLLDIVGLKMAPLYAQAWLKEEASIGIIKLVVHAPGTKEGVAATVSLSLQDGAPPAFVENIAYTDFPEGEWMFFMGTDEVGPEQYVSTMYLPQEH